MYEPGPMPTNAEPWIQRELLSISESQRRALPFLQLQVSYREPQRPRDGMIVVAPGAPEWDPGSGAGVYVFLSSTWSKL